MKERFKEHNKNLNQHIDDLNTQIADYARRCMQRSKALTLLNREHNDLLTQNADLKLKLEKVTQRLLDLSAQHTALKTSFGPRHERSIKKEDQGKGKKKVSFQDVDLSKLPSPTPAPISLSSDSEEGSPKEAKKARIPVSKKPSSRKD